MKKLVGLTTIIILFSLTVIAQGKRDGMRQGSEFTSEQMATLQAKKTTLYLDLDKNQQNAVYELYRKQAEERQIMKVNFKQNGVKLTSDERFKIQNNRLDRQLEHKAEMRKILSKEQFSKWEKLGNAKKRDGGKRIEKGKKMNQDCTKKKIKNEGQPARQFKKRS